MRILVISDLYPPVMFGGYEMECASVVEHLRRVHEVHVLTSERDRRHAAPTDGVLRELPDSGHSRRAALLAPAHALGAARTTRRVIAETQPDLVFIWNATAIPTAAVRIAADSGVAIAHRLCEGWFATRILLADHFLRYLVPGARGLRAVWGALLRLINRHPQLRLDPRAPYRAAVSWNSDALRNAVALPAPLEPLLERTIHPATGNGSYFATLSRAPAARPTILFIGRIWPQKGADVAVRALAALERRHGIDADLVMAGPYDRRSSVALRATAADLGVGDRIDLRGPLETKQLGEALQHAHALAAPSTAEAFGLACVEAAFARVPVVASRVGGIPEALRDEEHALLFAVGDVDGCAAALARTLTDKASTAARVERAFARAQEFSLERYLAATDRFIADTRAAFASDGRP